MCSIVNTEILSAHKILTKIQDIKILMFANLIYLLCLYRMFVIFEAITFTHRDQINSIRMKRQIMADIRHIHIPRHYGKTMAKHESWVSLFSQINFVLTFLVLCKLALWIGLLVLWRKFFLYGLLWKNLYSFPYISRCFTKFSTHY